jgi:hypothetical protein
MPKFRFKFFLFILAGATVYAACRKTDQPVNQQPTENQATRFFSGHASNDPFVQSITQFVKRENEKYNFVEKLIKQTGYPHWDKAIVTSGKKGIGNRETADSAATIFIPFVAENQNTVNASLVITTSPSDTSFRFLCDWQYKNRVHGSAATDTTAENLAALFMLLDNNVFEHTRFTLTDSSLFASMPVPPGATGREIVLNNPPPQLSGSNDLQTIIICFYVYVCRTPAWCANRGGCDYLHCPTGVCTYNYTCFDFEVEEGSGGGEEGGTGGSGGNGGGWTPPNNPNPCGVASRTELQEGCGTGWVPTGGSGSGTVPPPAEPIDSLLKRYGRAIKSRADSLLAKSLLLNWEHSMVIVGKRNSIYLKNEKTSQDSLSTGVDFTLGPREVLLGYIHCHSSKSLNVNDRSAPSGSDVKHMREKLARNFVQITECGNSSYAMVVEDSTKAKIFLDSITKYDLDPQIRDSAVKVTGWFFNWQNATQVALLKLLGSASLHGIGLYKSTDPMRESWIKLNR